MNLEKLIKKTKYYKNVIIDLMHVDKRLIALIERTNIIKPTLYEDMLEYEIEMRKNNKLFEQKSWSNINRIKVHNKEDGAKNG